MRRGWTKFLLCISVAALTQESAFLAHAQRNEPEKRANELTLAGLRPGKDTLTAALKHYRSKYLADGASGKASPTDPRTWDEPCTGRSLNITADEKSVIQEITVSTLSSREGKCDDRRLEGLDMKDWITGRGLRLGDSRNRVTELYGEPGTDGPSVKGEHELEFLYYAFDWAGADVPQVLEIYCERETGRVVEITLAYPSL